jgi:putative ABC transport system ATP-binding protein
MITHNNEIARLADRIVRIEDGRIVEKMPKSQLGGGKI